MVKRKIVEIDEEKCNGCGKCIPDCHEGALQIVDGKAKLVSEVYCDGLGNCLGHCPQDAIRIVEKEVKDFDFDETNKHLKNIGRKELKENPMEKPAETPTEKPKELPCGCPGTMMRDMRKPESGDSNPSNHESELQHWPIQLRLLPPNAGFFKGADLLIAADCVGFANPNLHQLMKGKSVVIGCPKLDNIEEHSEKIKAIIEMNDLNTITVAMMEVPCCHGFYRIVEEALDESGKRITLKRIVIGVDGKPKDM